MKEINDILLLDCLRTLATDDLFREIFAITGSLGRNLQGVDADLGTALGIINSSIAQLNQLRGKPERIIRCIEKDYDSESVVWQQI